MSCRMQRFVYLSFVSVLASSSAWGASQVTAIDFKGTTDPNEVDIQTDGPVTYVKEENVQNNQILIELNGAKISKYNSQKIDTSSFNSNVSLISPYQVVGSPDQVRVIIQLRGPGSVDVVQDGNTLKVKIPNKNSNIKPNKNPDKTEPDKAAVDKAAVDTSISSASAPEKTNLEEFVESKSAQKFSGKPITLQVRDVDVGDVLRLIGEASGFNLIVGDDVKGRVTLSLVDVPWDQALDVVLTTLHLGAERNNNILRVGTLKNLTAEKQEELNAKQAFEASAPRVTRVFPISYAVLADLQAMLTRFASEGAASKGGDSSGTSSIVQADNRTNSLVIRDTITNIEKMKKLIEILDTQTPQVMIEAKVVEATEGFTKSLGGSLGLSTTNSSNQFLSSFAGGNPLDPLVGSPGVFANGAAVSGLSSPTGGTPVGTFGISPDMSFLPGVSKLNAVLSWGESDSSVKVVSSPKTVVLNKSKATIVEGTPVLVPSTTTVAGVGTSLAQVVQQANISLAVTPTVTNDGSVLLDLNVSKDIPEALGGGNNGIGNRNLTTTVLVESGSTLVIGGIYTLQTDHSSSGFPILRHLPIIGALFGNDSADQTRSELFIFVTPRIINPKEAGLSS